MSDLKFAALLIAGSIFAILFLIVLIASAAALWHLLLAVLAILIVAGAFWVFVWIQGQ